ncbi:MAG TPA: ComF family protein [Herpetosiphonaceae bacterium]
MLQAMQSLIDNLLDLLFPPRCAGCKSQGALLCAACQASCRFVPDAANREQHLRLNSPFLLSTAGAYVFEGAIREAVHTLKYNRRKRMAQPLGQLLNRYLVARPIAIDAIVAVPLHPERLRKRGFNQAGLLAQQLARQAGLPLLATQLVRVRQTSQQADLNRAQRRENVRAAFAWQAASPPPQRILVIDDVLTTGATVEAAAQALHAAGAREVHALALARGL